MNFCCFKNCNKPVISDEEHLEITKKNEEIFPQYISKDGKVTYCKKHFIIQNKIYCQYKYLEYTRCPNIIFHDIIIIKDMIKKNSNSAYNLMIKVYEVINCFKKIYELRLAYQFNLKENIENSGHLFYISCIKEFIDNFAITAMHFIYGDDYAKKYKWRKVSKRKRILNKQT
jgi:hypothetical protein